MKDMTITYIGGPTALIETGGASFLTDPAFDAAGTEYSIGPYSLRKTSSPAVAAEELGRLDAVLLSHDHHFDNLDHAGRALLSRADRVFTTPAGAQQLGGNALGLSPWENVRVTSNTGKTIIITATPARHGPADGDRGPVTGFILEIAGQPEATAYFSGDTVWFEGVEEVARRFQIHWALLNMGAARVLAAGPDHLTFTADEGVKVAKAMPSAKVVPMHYEGWEHFSESRRDIEAAFRKAGLERNLFWPKPGERSVLTE